MNTLRKRLKSDRVVIGSWINSASAIVAELMAAVGGQRTEVGRRRSEGRGRRSVGGGRFDFLTVDAEHSAVDLVQVQALFQAIRSGNPNCAALVRVPGCDYSQIKRYMDAGAAGVICPLVNTPEEARIVVDAVKYPQDRGRRSEIRGRRAEAAGRRGVGFCRDNGYGVRLVDTVRRSNGETMVGVQIEHILAVESIDHILSVPGVDVAFVGPYDLTASMGITAQFDHPNYLAAKRKILAACRRHHVVAGIHVVQPDPSQVRKAIRQGYRFIAYSLDITMLSVACERGLADIKSHLSAATVRSPKHNTPSTKH